MNNPKDWLTSYLLDATVGDQDAAGAPDVRQALLHFLPVLDALDRLIVFAASAPAQPEAEAPNWLDQLRTLRKQFLQAFERTGVTFLDSVGQPFDPTRHEVAEVVQRSDVQDQTVVEELSRGCYWQGDVLRFARVVVAQNTD